jgi:hypothetical protein
MGIGVQFLNILAKLRADGFLEPPASVVEIGAQQLDNSFLEASDEIARLRELFGIDQPVDLPPPQPTHILRGSLEHLSPNAPRARLFWTWLGFNYAAIDIDGSPGSLALDLNYDAVPPAFVGKHDLVTNFGTTEHVANQVNAFKVIHDLTALGGLMIHELPGQGYFNHGLINYNFKFFWMLARSNDYKFIFADCTADAPYDLPLNIADFILSMNPDAAEEKLRFSGTDCGFTVILQKTLDIPFVAPLDVDTGVQTDNKLLKQRYWTVFDPETLEKVRRERSKA